MAIKAIQEKAKATPHDLPILGYPNKGDEKPERGVGVDLPDWRRVTWVYGSSDMQAHLQKAWAELIEADPATIECRVVAFDYYLEERYPKTQALVNRCDGERRSHYRDSDGILRSMAQACLNNKGMCKCKPVIYVKLWIPKLVEVTGVAGYLMLVSKSVSDVEHLANVLEKAKNIDGFSLSEIDFVLRRVPTKIEHEGKTKTHYLVRLDYHPEWVKLFADKLISGSKIVMDELEPQEIEIVPELDPQEPEAVPEQEPAPIGHWSDNVPQDWITYIVDNAEKYIDGGMDVLLKVIPDLNGAIMANKSDIELLKRFVMWELIQAQIPLNVWGVIVESVQNGGRRYKFPIGFGFQATNYGRDPFKGAGWVSGNQWKELGAFPFKMNNGDSFSIKVGVENSNSGLTVVSCEKPREWSRTWHDPEPQAEQNPKVPEFPPMPKLTTPPPFAQEPSIIDEVENLESDVLTRQDLEKATIEEMKKYCKSIGITGYSRANRQGLIDLIINSGAVDEGF